MIAIELSVAVALLASYGFLTLLLFAGALVRGAIWRSRSRASAALVPGICDAFVDYLGGSDDLSRLRNLAQTQKRAFGDAIIKFRGTVAGAALDRLCRIALDFGLVQQWIGEAHARDPVRRRAAFDRLAFVSAYGPCRHVIGDLPWIALGDADREVRMRAALCLVQSGGREAIERVFGLAVSETLLVRILLAEALRPYAAALCTTRIPEELRSADSRRLLATLELLVAWERAVPIHHLHELLDHPDKRVRLAALRLAPYVPPEAESRAAIVLALKDPDSEVTTAATLTAGQLRIEEALPSLARLLRVAPAALARTAAAALAEMPPRGWETLRELSSNPSSVTAALAGEALARVRKDGE